MTGVLLQIGATKLVVSLVLAVVAWAVGRRAARPSVSYALWLLVLLALLVPAVVSVPVLPAEPAVTAAVPEAGAPEAETLTLREGFRARLLEAVPVLSAGPDFRAFAGTLLALAWLLGSAGLLAWTIARTVRFRRALATGSRRAPAWLRREAAALARALGLARTPEVRTADARVTPLVWWTGGRVRVLVPAFLLTELNAAERRAILAHELAHVRRRDHLVRWLEWLACSAFWWNPAAWWPRREFRAAEESCCDRIALDAAGSSPRTYANALLRVVAGTSGRSGLRPPLPATAADGAARTHILERRIRMIVSTDTRSPAPRRPRALTWTVMLCALPLGLVYCDRPSAPVEPEAEAVAPAEGYDAAVEAYDAAAEAYELGHDSILLAAEAAEIRERLRRVAEQAVQLTRAAERELERRFREAKESGGASRDSARLSEQALEAIRQATERSEQVLEAFRASRQVARPAPPLLIWSPSVSPSFTCPPGERPVTAAEAHSDSRKPQLMAVLRELRQHLGERKQRKSTPEWMDRFEELQARYEQLVCTEDK